MNSWNYRQLYSSLERYNYEEMKSDTYQSQIGLVGYYRNPIASYNIDRSNYELYLNNNIERELSLDEQHEMNILITLDRLGFPMDHIGTYFYKDVILQIKSCLDEIIENKDLEKYEGLKILLSGFGSVYYKKAALKSNMRYLDFHAVIEDAIKKIELEKMDKNLYYDIFHDLNFEKNYGELVIPIALHSFEKEDIKECNENEAPKIKLMLYEY